MGYKTIEEQPCGICGKIFPSFHGSKYCCDQCRRESARRHEQARAEEKKKRYKHANEALANIAAVARAARAEGLQYGAYVAKHGL